MIDDFKHTPFNPAPILAEFAAFPTAAPVAKAAADMHMLLLTSFDALDQRLSPIAKLADTLTSFGIPDGMGSLFGESPELRATVDGIRKSDKDIQTMASQGLAKAFAVVDRCLANDGANGDVAAQLLSALRSACIDSLPTRCQDPWSQYLHKVEVAYASMGSIDAPKGDRPRL